MAIITRRQAIVGAGASVALAGGLRNAAAADSTIKVGFISPRTGPLGGFGQTDR